MSEYVIKSFTDEDDKFDIKGKNVGKVSVRDKNGNDITSDCRVFLDLSKEGIEGLGTELIRFSKRLQDGMHIHIQPVEKDFICQYLGFYLTSSSCELVVGCTDFDVIEDYLKDNKSE